MQKAKLLAKRKGVDKAVKEERYSLSLVRSKIKCVKRS